MTVLDAFWFAEIGVMLLIPTLILLVIVFFMTKKVSSIAFFVSIFLYLWGVIFTIDKFSYYPYAIFWLLMGSTFVMVALSAFIYYSERHKKKIVDTCLLVAIAILGISLVGLVVVSHFFIEPTYQPPEAFPYQPPIQSPTSSWWSNLPSDRTGITVKVDQTECEGKCPEFILNVVGGRGGNPADIVYYGLQGVAGEGPIYKNIPREKNEQLLQLLQRSGFENLPPELPGDDIGARRLSINFAQKHKAVLDRGYTNSQLTSVFDYVLALADWKPYMDLSTVQELDSGLTVENDMVTYTQRDCKGECLDYTLSIVEGPAPTAPAAFILDVRGKNPRVYFARVTYLEFDILMNAVQSVNFFGQEDRIESLTPLPGIREITVVRDGKEKIVIDEAYRGPLYSLYETMHGFNEWQTYVPFDPRRVKERPEGS